jgi:hypothetical protein
LNFKVLYLVALIGIKFPAPIVGKFTRMGVREMDAVALFISQDKLWNVVVIELGAGNAIPSVRYFSEQTSKNYGARIIRINPREFDVPSKLDVGIPMGSLEALAGIDAALGAEPPDMDLDFT